MPGYSSDQAYEGMDLDRDCGTSEDFNWWMGLGPELRHYYVRATEPLNLDHTGGLMQLEERIWVGSKRVPALIILVLRLLLNAWTVMQNATHIFDQEHRANRDAHSSIGEHRATFCGKNMTAWGGPDAESMSVQSQFASASPIDCITVPVHLLSLYQIVALFETIVLGILMISCLFAMLIFLVFAGWDWGRKLPQQRPFLFVMVPHIASSFSSISCIQFISSARMNSVAFRGEGKFLLFFARDAICPMIKDDKDLADVQGIFKKAHSVSVDEKAGHVNLLCIGRTISFIVLTMFLTSCGAAAILVKINLIHFAMIDSVRYWTLTQWLQMLGFANQLAGICMAEHLDMQRLLLFKFGGADSKWSDNDARTAVGYFHLLAKKIVEGRIGGVGRISALAAMCTLTADDMQKLLFNPWMHRSIKQSRDKRYELLSEFFPGSRVSTAEQMAEEEDWLNVLHHIEHHGRREEDEYSDTESDSESHADSAEHRVKIGCRMSHLLFHRAELYKHERDKLLQPDPDHGMMSSWKLRLASEIQECIDDVRKDRLMYLRMLGVTDDDCAAVDGAQAAQWSML